MRGTREGWVKRGLVLLAIVVVGAACAPGGPTTAPPESSQTVPYGPIQVFERRNVAYGPHVQQQLDLWRPVGAPSPQVVLYVHGGFWQDQPVRTRAEIPPAVKDLLLHGFAVATMSYRGTNPEAGDVVHPAGIHDVKRAVAYLSANRSTLGVGVGISLVGYSAGGHLAAMAATTFGDSFLTPTGITEARVQSFVSVAGPTDLPALAAIVDENTINRALGFSDYVCGSPAAGCSPNASMSPMTYASADDPPALLIYGSNDTLVPDAQGALYANALNGAGAVGAFRTLPADHDSIQSLLVTQQLADWLHAPSV